MSQVGVKETKDALVGVLAVAAVVAERVKDGVGADDVVVLVQKLMADEELKAKLAEAQKDAALIPAELKDLQAAEVVELIAAALPSVMAVIAALKK
jgi:hypothetical protein